MGESSGLSGMSSCGYYYLLIGEVDFSESYLSIEEAWVGKLELLNVWAGCLSCKGTESILNSGCGFITSCICYTKGYKGAWFSSTADTS